MSSLQRARCALAATLHCCQLLHGTDRSLACASQIGLPVLPLASACVCDELLSGDQQAHCDVWCVAAGYVRRTSAAPPDNDDHLIINRPLLWNGKFEAKLDPDQQNGRTASKQKSGNGVAADARMGNGKQ